MAKNLGQTLRDKSGPQLIASMKTGISGLHLQETKFCQEPHEFERRPCPTPDPGLQKRTEAKQLLDFSFMRP